MKKSERVLSVLAVASISLFSCLEESEYEKQVKRDDQEIMAYLKDNNITAKRSSTGIYYEELVENANGTIPELGDVVFIKYDMKTLDGNVVESNTETLTKFKFAWTSIMPNGFNYGVDLLKKGEKNRFYLPSYLAFDSYSFGDVFSSFENFIVEMELVDFKTEDEMYEIEIDSIDNYITANQIEGVESYTSGLYFKTIESGSGDSPTGYSEVEFYFTRKYLDGTVIEKTEALSPLKVKLNEGRLVEGLRQGILKMKEGDKALLIMPSEIAFGASIQVIPTSLREEFLDDNIITTKVVPYTPVLYEVELVSVD
ncbi:FKBP-type peptidyl-prolyl cis-trans isomerase [Reichenbachiella sp. MALMAid0571]|uniref:FKBP-type peptidyl-prolyl cis-trans isomerase n=1 Tax=Reichenbachiella sp. MALMAid0571 TaxID=3143939 RepID=UPI0032E0038A